MMKGYSRNKNKGFTLIELILYIGLTGLVLTSITGYFMNLLKTYTLTRNLISIANDQAIVFEKINTDIRYAENVDDATCIFDDDNGKLVVIKDGNSYEYYLESGAVVKSVNSGSAVPITSNDVSIVKLRFEKIDTVHGKEGVNMTILTEALSASVGKIERESSSDIFVRESSITY